MKWMLLLLLALPATQSIAQNLGKQFEWVKLAPEQLPVKSSNIYYDITVPMDEEAYPREKLDENTAYYFGNVFGTTIVSNEGKHKMSGVGSYSFSTNKSANANDIYTVNYVLDISTKNGKYTMTMHDFTLNHLDVQISLENRIESAGRNDQLSKQMLACIHRNNLDELKKAYLTMQKGGSPVAATAKN